MPYAWWTPGARTCHYPQHPPSKAPSDYGELKDLLRAILENQQQTNEKLEALEAENRELRHQLGRVTSPHGREPPPGSGNPSSGTSGSS